MHRGKAILGINRTQDAGVCVLSDRGLFAIHKERLSGIKHDWGRRGDVKKFYRQLSELDRQIDLVVECYSSDKEIEYLSDYHSELRQELNIAPDADIVRISHHLAHLYSAMPASGFKEAACMVIDFQGSPIRDLTEVYTSNSPGDFVEVSSFYQIRNEEVECIAKQTWDCDRERPVGLGCFYFFLTQMIFPGEGNEGKVMGLAPFGNPGQLGLPDLDVRDHEVYIPDEWLAIFKSKDFLFNGGNDQAFQKSADLALVGQKVFELALIKLANWLSERTGLPNLCYAGGTALNCVANQALKIASSFQELYIPPAPHDGGTAVGCAAYGASMLSGRWETIDWRTDYLGPDRVSRDNDLDLHLGFQEIVDRDTVEAVAQLLAAGKIVALYNGRSEFGPRALGNRSFLANPSSSLTRDFINLHVKGRETFRPLAPIVQEESAHIYFEINSPSPHMLYACNVKADWRERLAGITHVDGTARVQTLSKDVNPFLHDVITSFARMTGVAVLINTSLNGKGEPIVESSTDALRLASTLPVDALVIPPRVLVKDSVGSFAHSLFERDQLRT